MAGVTGLEPAASGVTGQRSNQLSYTPSGARAGEPGNGAAVMYSSPRGVSSEGPSLPESLGDDGCPGLSGRPARAGRVSLHTKGQGWWAMTGSNRRPSRCKRDALPAELIARPFGSGTQRR